MLQGSLQDFPLPNLLQMLAGSGVTGRLSLEHARGGELWLRNGEVVHALALGRSGDDALDLLASVTDGSFSFVPLAAPDEHTVSLRGNALLRQLTLSGDEWRGLLPLFPDWNAPLHFTPRWSTQQPVTHGQYRVLSLVGQLTLDELLRRSELPPRATLEILRPFVQSGLLSAPEYSAALP